MIAFLFLVLAVGCRAISELALHNKLRWREGYYTFWGGGSWVRKYKNNYTSGGQSVVNCEPAPTTYYYKLFNLKYKERYFGSATFLVAFTDGSHLCQSLFFIFISLSFSIATELNFFLVWGGILLCHFVTYRVLQR